MASHRYPDRQALWRASACVHALRLCLLTLFLVCALARSTEAQDLAVDTVTAHAVTIYDEPVHLLPSEIGTIVREAQPRVAVLAAEDEDGRIHRFEVESTDGSATYWLVFALHNATGRALDLVFDLPHASSLPSAGLRETFDASRLLRLSVSEGAMPVRQLVRTGDRFSIFLAEGARVTFIAELASPDIDLARLLDQQSLLREGSTLALLRGFSLGACALLVLLTLMLLVARPFRHTFPILTLSAAVLGIVALELRLLPEGVLVSTGTIALTQALLSLVFSLSLLAISAIFLDLARTAPRLTHLWLTFAGFLVVVGALAFVEPDLALMIGTFSQSLIGFFGLAILCGYAYLRDKMALLLLPAWLTLSLWLAASVLMTSLLSTGPHSETIITSGLILVAALFAASALYVPVDRGKRSKPNSMSERSAELVTRAGGFVWTYRVNDEHLHLGEDLARALGFAPDKVCGPLRTVGRKLLHPADFPDLLAALNPSDGQARSRFNLRLRLVDDQGQDHLFALRAYFTFAPLSASDPTEEGMTDQRCLLCLGLLLPDASGALLGHARETYGLLDPLTRLPKEALFRERLGQLTDLADRLAPEIVWLAFFDFLQGDEASEAFDLSLDRAAIVFSSRLQTGLRSGETLARLGPLRFALLGTSADRSHLTGRLSSLLEKAVRLPVDLRGSAVIMRGVGGLAFAAPEDSPDLLLHKTAIATFRASRTGAKTPFEVYSERGARLSTQQRTAVQTLERAATRGGIDLRSAPIFDLTTQAVVGERVWPAHKESLLGWQDLSLPQNPTLDKPLLVIALRQLDLAFSALSRRKRNQQGHLHICLPSRTLFANEVVARLKREATAFAGQSHAPFTLCLTETDLLFAGNDAIDALNEYRALGYTFSMRGFGEGHGCLTPIVRYAFSTLFHTPHANLSLDELRLWMRLSKTFDAQLVLERVNDHLTYELAKNAGLTLATGTYMTPNATRAGQLGSKLNIWNTPARIVSDATP